MKSVFVALGLLCTLLPAGAAGTTSAAAGSSEAAELSPTERETLNAICHFLETARNRNKAVFYGQVCECGRGKGPQSRQHPGKKELNIIVNKLDDTPAQPNGVDAVMCWRYLTPPPTREMITVSLPSSAITRRTSCPWGSATRA